MAQVSAGLEGLEGFPAGCGYEANPRTSPTSGYAAGTSKSDLVTVSEPNHSAFLLCIHHRTNYGTYQPDQLFHGSWSVCGCFGPSANWKPLARWWLLEFCRLLTVRGHFQENPSATCAHGLRGG